MTGQPRRESFGGIPSLSAGRYFELLKSAYQLTGYDLEKESYFGYSKDDGRAWYCRFGDARDQSLLEIDSDDPEAFRSWYEDKRQHLDHNFEIFQGRGCHRVHLNPSFDERGWHLSMWGSITWHGADMARIWRFMNESGMPTYQYDATELADALTGEDYVLVMPTHTSIDYVRGEYFGNTISTAIHLPYENWEPIAQVTQWQPVEVATLIDVS